MTHNCRNHVRKVGGTREHKLSSQEGKEDVMDSFDYLLD
jgi:hypothetical protein